MTRAQIFSTVGRVPSRPRTTRLELFCMFLGTAIFGYLIGWLHATAVFVGW